MFDDLGRIWFCENVSIWSVRDELILGFFRSSLVVLTLIMLGLCVFEFRSDAWNVVLGIMKLLSLFGFFGEVEEVEFGSGEHLTFGHIYMD